MDLAWCPVCDKHIFVIENLYCSEACRKKDASTILNEKSCYEFPRCSSRKKPYQSPYNSLYNSPESSPVTSPKLYPIMTIMDYGFQSITISSLPSDLSLYGTISDSSIIKSRKDSSKKYL
ncbi:hypothetical protein C1645_822351 [Glomus cerebriforme]|uniref:Uncharacterized protein n=1 Tax=Glomus cerebriforme TaxID=658196 RepID=A0A397T7U8_9GLOM|nr:hypothetical protein C1645_822351 [Glomus cerebriforme]